MMASRSPAIQTIRPRRRRPGHRRGRARWRRHLALLVGEPIADLDVHRQDWDRRSGLVQCRAGLRSPLVW